jgi:hypothetical protein
MSINEFAAVLTHRDSVCAFAIIALTIGLALVFNFMPLFGGATP